MRLACGRARAPSADHLHQEVGGRRRGHATLFQPRGEPGDPLRVAHDEKRRVLEILTVVAELAVGGREVLLLALVLPGKETALPDVGKAVAAAELLGKRLEAVPLALGIGFRWSLLTQ